MLPVVADLARLVAFPTVSSQPVTAIAAFLAERCADLGFAIERFDDPTESGKTNIVASVGPQSPGGLLLSGHMDVVPAAGQPWTSDPFVLAERDGRLYGRGVADMKGFIAACLQAIARIERDSWRRPLLLIWTHDEEVGCHGSAHLCDRLLEQDRHLPEACWVGEPTDFNLLRMHSGHIAVRIEIEGRAAHTAFPELGANAIEASARAVAAMADLAARLQTERHQRPEGLDRPWVPLSVTRVAGGEAINIVPEHCTIDLGYRPLPGMDHAPVWHRLRETLAELRLPAGTRAGAAITRQTPSLCTPAGTELERILAPHADIGGSPAAPYATDGGNFARAGAQPLIFGPGSIAVAHRADEHLAVTDLIRCVDVLERVVRARCC